MSDSTSSRRGSLSQRGSAVSTPTNRRLSLSSTHTAQSGAPTSASGRVSLSLLSQFSLQSTRQVVAATPPPNTVVVRVGRDRERERDRDREIDRDRERRSSSASSRASRSSAPRTEREREKERARSPGRASLSVSLSLSQSTPPPLSLSQGRTPRSSLSFSPHAALSLSLSATESVTPPRLSLSLGESAISLSPPHNNNIVSQRSPTPPPTPLTPHNAASQSATAETIRVCVRVRPLLLSQSEPGESVAWSWTEREISMLARTSSSTPLTPSHSAGTANSYAFDHVFAPSASNEDVFVAMARDVVEDALLRGVSGCVLCYGQTSSGKTHTMHGSASAPGVIALAIQHVFKHIERERERGRESERETLSETERESGREREREREFSVSVSYVEVYNEALRDLLCGLSDTPPPHNAAVSQPALTTSGSTSVSERERDRERVKLQFDARTQRSVLVGARERGVRGAAAALALLRAGETQRHVGATRMNEQSSRAHTVFRLTVQSWERDTDRERDRDKERENEQQLRGPPNANAKIRCAALYLVDLAGSESAKATHSTGERAREAKHINRSLLTLSTIIQRLSEDQLLSNNALPTGSSHVTNNNRHSTGSNSTESKSNTAQSSPLPNKRTSHLPYRDSKLTRLLESALDGSARIAIVCAVSPSLRCAEETLNTLKFANRAKTIRTHAQTNESLMRASQSLSLSALASLVKIYKAEIDTLRETVKVLESERERERARERERERESLTESVVRTLSLSHNNALSPGAARALKTRSRSRSLSPLAARLRETERETERVGETHDVPTQPAHTTLSPPHSASPSLSHSAHAENERDTESERDRERDGERAAALIEEIERAVHALSLSRSHSHTHTRALSLPLSLNEKETERETETERQTKRKGEKRLGRRFPMPRVNSNEAQMRKLTARLSRSRSLSARERESLAHGVGEQSESDSDVCSRSVDSESVCGGDNSVSECEEEEDDDLCERVVLPLRVPSLSLEELTTPLPSADVDLFSHRERESDTHTHSHILARLSHSLSRSLTHSLSSDTESDKDVDEGDAQCEELVATISTKLSTLKDVVQTSLSYKKHSHSHRKLPVSPSSVPPLIESDATAPTQLDPTEPAAIASSQTETSLDTTLSDPLIPPTQCSALITEATQEQREIQRLTLELSLHRSDNAFLQDELDKKDNVLATLTEGLREIDSVQRQWIQRERETASQLEKALVANVWLRREVYRLQERDRERLGSDACDDSVFGESVSVSERMSAISDTDSLCVSECEDSSVCLSARDRPHRSAALSLLAHTSSGERDPESERPPSLSVRDRIRAFEKSA